MSAYSRGALAAPTPGSTLLVRLPNPLGDVVMATPLLRALRRQLPGTRILAVGLAAYGPLLEGLDSLDGFLALPPRGGGDDEGGRSGGGGSGSGSAVAREAAVLAAAGAQTALLLPNSWSTALAAWRAGIPTRIGRRKAGRGLLLQRRLPPIPGPAPMTELYADFLPALGLEREVPPAELVAGEPRTSLPAGTEFLAVAPGAAFGPSKKLPVETLVAALDGFHAQTGMVPLLLGSPAERAELEALRARLRAPAILPAPEHSGLDESKALLRRSRGLLAMDNGARHMAAALGVPQLAVYGPTHPAWSAHALERTVLLRREELDCLACHNKVCPLADHPCMTRIRPEDLVAALHALPEPELENGDR